MMMNERDRGLRRLHSRVLDAFVALVADMDPEDLTRPTPCTEWDVQALLEHHVAQNDALARSIGDGCADVQRGRPHPLDDLPTALRRTSEQLRERLADDAMWDRRVWMPEISDAVAFTTSQTVHFHFLDTVVHAWDVAAATGRAVRFSADELVLAGQIAQQVPTGEARSAPDASFAQPVAASTTPGSLDATVAQLGRNPQWRAPSGPTP